MITYKNKSQNAIPRRRISGVEHPDSLQDPLARGGGGASEEPRRRGLDRHHARAVLVP